MTRRLVGLFLVLLLACGDSAADSNGDPVFPDSDVDGSVSAGGAGGAVGPGGAGGGDGMGDAGMPPPFPYTPGEPYLPEVTGTCPELVQGKLTFSPEGVTPPREVEIHISDAAKDMDGPIIFYWHGLGSSPGEANIGLNGVLDEIKAAGGIVAAPYHDPAAGQFPWFEMVADNRPDDWLVADEILACAMEQVGIDPNRIHSIGMSAGGLNTSQMVYRRAQYLASATAYSGGMNLGGAPTDQRPENRLPMLMYHGGPMDIVILNFQDTTLAMEENLKEEGHSIFVCNHNMRHTIPAPGPASAWRFFQDHPFGTDPSPYEADGLPDVFPDYCPQ